MTLLTVDNLHTHFVIRDSLDEIRVARALNGVSFTLAEGKILGLVGETGAGKSLTAMTMLGLLRPPARHVNGTASFLGQDLTTLGDDALTKMKEIMKPFSDQTLADLAAYYATLR